MLPQKTKLSAVGTLCPSTQIGLKLKNIGVKSFRINDSKVLKKYKAILTKTVHLDNEMLDM